MFLPLLPEPGDGLTGRLGSLYLTQVGVPHYASVCFLEGRFY